MRRALLIAALGGVAAASCAGATASREPMLTNPPRMDAWFGGESEPDQRSWVERKYAGTQRPPFLADWTWDLPDEGRWEISRLELCDPVVHGDRVYVGSSRRPGLFVLSRGSGLLETVHPTDGPVQSPPVRLADGWLLVDSFGVLERLDDDLKTLWTYRSGGAVFRSPLVADDQVLVSLSGDTVVAVGLADGVWRWSHKREVRRGSQELAILGGPRPVVAEGLVFTGFSDGYVAALDPATGKEKWARSVGRGKFPDVQADLVIEGDTLIVSAFSGPTVGLDPETGSERWRNDDVGAAWPMAVADGSLYISDSRGNVHGVNAQTGATEWTWALPDTPFLAVFRQEPGNVEATDVSTLDGAARAARRAEREQRLAEQRAAMRDPNRRRGPGPKPNGQVGRPTRAGSLVLVGDVNGTLYALDRFDGTEAWRWMPRDGTAPFGVAAAPAIAGRQVVFTTAGGRLVSLIGSTAFSVDLSESPARRLDRRVGW